MGLSCDTDVDPNLMRNQGTFNLPRLNLAKEVEDPWLWAQAQIHLGAAEERDPPRSGSELLPRKPTFGVVLQPSEPPSGAIGHKSRRPVVPTALLLASTFPGKVAKGVDGKIGRDLPAGLVTRTAKDSTLRPLCCLEPPNRSGVFPLL